MFFNECRGPRDTAYHVPGDAHGFHGSGKSAAPAGQVVPLHNSGNYLKGSTNKAIPGSIYGLLIKATRHPPTIQQLVTCCRQDVDATTHPIKNVMPGAIAQTKAATQPLLDRMS
jgi:hypothetical protein